MDPRSDIYALGCVAYWLLSGRPVFEKANVHQMLVAHVREPAPSLRARNCIVPEALESLLLQCLAKSPADRPSNVATIGAELLRIELSLSIEECWSEVKARAWWEAHGPAVPAATETSAQTPQYLHLRSAADPT